MNEIYRIGTFGSTYRILDERIHKSICVCENRENAEFILSVIKKLKEIAEIAHRGGLKDISANDALTAIRKLTFDEHKKYFCEDKNINISKITRTVNYEKTFSVSEKEYNYILKEVRCEINKTIEDEFYNSLYEEDKFRHTFIDRNSILKYNDYHPLGVLISRYV